MLRSEIAQHGQLHNGAGRREGRQRIDFLEVVGALDESIPTLLEVFVDAGYIDCLFEAQSALALFVENR